MTDSRLGAPVELPWWIIPLGIPPVLVVILAVMLNAPLWSRALAMIASLLTLLAMAVIATRVASRNMQSVWISALYAGWVFAVITWAVVVVTTPACNCT
jgi:hypothetical protein